LPMITPTNGGVFASFMRSSIDDHSGRPSKWHDSYVSLTTAESFLLSKGWTDELWITLEHMDWRLHSDRSFHDPLANSSVRAEQNGYLGCHAFPRVQQRTQHRRLFTRRGCGRGLQLDAQSGHRR